MNFTGESSEIIGQNKGLSAPDLLPFPYLLLKALPWLPSLRILCDRPNR